MARGAALLIGALILAGCGPASDPASAFAAALRSAGAEVREAGAFNTGLLGVRGVRLCVSGQQVSVDVFPTPEEREAAASQIDARDPSVVGRAIIEWAGNPTFWQGGRVLVLYLGRDPAVEGSIGAIMGAPFARGRGRDPGPDRHVC